MKEGQSLELTEIKGIIREYCEQLYANKLDYSDEMDKFLERHKLARLTQEEWNNLNRHILSKEIKVLIKI